MIAPRRTFLRQLACLPLVGGGITLIGQPTAAATPITLQLAEAYLGWLRLEQTKLMHEIIDRPLSGGGWQTHMPHSALPRCPSLISAVISGPASARAAVILSAAGVNPSSVDASACAGLADRGAETYEKMFDPFIPSRDDESALDAYREQVFKNTGPLLLNACAWRKES